MEPSWLLRTAQALRKMLKRAFGFRLRGHQTLQLMSMNDTNMSGLGCSKHRQLNELVSGQTVNCSSKYNI